ncbi:MAG: hypothetical protein JXB13_13350, partial [Phycisphaerae bacterium]|nr:hypothetical protein [Phycisphaerae bacterium]
MTLDVRYAWTAVDDTRSAFQEVRERVAQPSPACVLFFCSPNHDLDELARGIAESYDWAIPDERGGAHAGSD